MTGETRLQGGASNPEHAAPHAGWLDEDEVRRAGAAYREILGQQRPDPNRPRRRWARVLTPEGEVELDVGPAGEDA